MAAVYRELGFVKQEFGKIPLFFLKRGRRGGGGKCGNDFLKMVRVSLKLA